MNRGVIDLMSSQAKHKAVDSIAIESFVSLNESAAKQWETFAEGAQTPEVKRLLAASVQMERKFAHDLKELLPKVAE